MSAVSCSDSATEAVLAHFQAMQAVKLSCLREVDQVSCCTHDTCAESSAHLERSLAAMLLWASWWILQVP